MWLRVVFRCERENTRLSPLIRTALQLQSETTGACLWVLGISLMILPLWILGRHLPDVASALARLLG